MHMAQIKVLKSKLKKLPVFKNEDDERNFWAPADSSDYIDWKSAKREVVFPNLKMSSKIISIRLPENLINAIKRKANMLDVPYQSYMKTILHKEFMTGEK